MPSSDDGFTTEVEQLDGAGKKFTESADTAWEAARSFTDAGNAFRRASSGNRDLLDPAHEKWTEVETEVGQVQKLMHEAISKTGEALVEIARRYRQQDEGR